MKIPDWKWILKWKIMYPIKHGHRYHYELAVRKVMFSMSGASFWDVGANTGYYTVPLAKKFDQITACEPNPAALEFLRRRIAKAHLTNVKILPVALSDSIGTGRLYTPTKVPPKIISASNSLIAARTFGARIPSESESVEVPFVEVETNTIDNLLGDQTVDLMKIDVEGAEFMVLEGGRRGLHDLRIKKLMVELHDWKRKDELEGLLSAYHYTVDWLDFAPEAATCHALATANR